jgi:hypothetical protein
MEDIFFIPSVRASGNLHQKKLSIGYVCFPESDFREITFQTFLYLFFIRKVGQRTTLSDQQKTLSSQRKI